MQRAIMGRRMLRGVVRAYFSIGPQPPPFVSAGELKRHFSTSGQPHPGPKTRRGFRRFADVGVCGRGKHLQRLTNTDPSLCGEDSFFVSDAHVHTLGVADGVGGWREAGVDPGEIARRLMHNAKELADMKYILPHWLLAEAYWKIKYAAEVGAGSTTACIVSLRDTVSHPPTGAPSFKQTLFSANLGDSGWVLLRGGKAAELSQAQRREQVPKQLAVVPPALQGDGYMASEPYEAGISTHDVISGDILVLATDGLWDNIDIPQVEGIVQKTKGNMNAVATALTEAAATFPRKPDDITVVVAQV
eukprot:Hpha_TRINITY_DN15359_c1_g2::TRINITY_DN15359_c1_g2_i1::g.88206::m.88206/K17508/PTC7, PPTC7; protein phosphatase PTC7